jgi:formylmethanofuran dehydrogenase subunit B
MAKGLLTKGRVDRKVVVVDVRKTVSALMASHFIQIKPGSDYLVFSALRALIKGYDDVVPDEVGGVSKEKLKELAEMIKNAKYITILFGLGLSHTRGHDRNVENIIKLVQLTNRYTRCILQPMRGHYNVVGAGEVAAWECGFEWAVDFSRGYPRFAPSEYTGVETLLRRDVDAALIVSSDPAAHFPKAAVEQLKKIPIIQIDPFPNITTLISDVVIPCAITGIEAEGTAYRMDGVPIRVKKIIESEYWSDEEILGRMLEKVTSQLR